MSRLVPHRPHPLLSNGDLAYVRAEFLPLGQIAHREQVDTGQLSSWIESGRLPRPAYLLPDGTPVFPADLLALMRSAGGLDPLSRHFAHRIELAARMLGFSPNTRESDWEDYLSGEYGICLRQVTPETLVLKELLVERIGRALEEPRPQDHRWRRTLAFDIEGLDSLVRPFARVDRVRFGRQTSRERLIEAPRRRWAWLRERHDEVAESSLTSDSRASTP
jgi:Family of unknown function (DUF6058)